MSYKGFSNLLIRTLKQMLFELENIRISPRAFLDIFIEYEKRLKNVEFLEHDKILRNLVSLQSNRENKSYQETDSFMNEKDPVINLSINERFLEESADLIDIKEHGGEKFDPDFMEKDSFIDIFN